MSRHPGTNLPSTRDLAMVRFVEPALLGQDESCSLLSWSISIYPTFPGYRQSGNNVWGWLLEERILGMADGLMGPAGGGKVGNSGIKGNDV